MEGARHVEPRIGAEDDPRRIEQVEIRPGGKPGGARGHSEQAIDRGLLAAGDTADDIRDRGLRGRRTAGERRATAGRHAELAETEEEVRILEASGSGGDGEVQRASEGRSARRRGGVERDLGQNDARAHKQADEERRQQKESTCNATQRAGPSHQISVQPSVRLLRADEADKRTAPQLGDKKILRSCGFREPLTRLLASRLLLLTGAG